MHRVLPLIAATLLAAVLLPAAHAHDARKPAPHGPFHALKFRDLGPAVAGGRVTSVLGVPGDAGLYYVGAAGGGVWKTTDGGTTWKSIFDHEPTQSIGALALAGGNPNWLWVGTGEGNPRNDILNGKGVYFTPDGGKTWSTRACATPGRSPPSRWIRRIPGPCSCAPRAMCGSAAPSVACS